MVIYIAFIMKIRLNIITTESSLSFGFIIKLQITYILLLKAIHLDMLTVAWYTFL